MKYSENRIVKRAISENSDINIAIKEIQGQLGDNHNLIMYFAAPTYDSNSISKKFQDAFPNTPTIGCTTGGEVFGGALYENTIAAVAFTPDIIKNVSIQVVENLDDINNVNKAIKALENAPAFNFNRENSDKYVGIIFADGLSKRLEKLMDRINDLTNVFFTGGAAADNWAMKHTYVFANGKTYENAAVLALLEPTVGFKVFKTLAFKPMGRTFKVTKADEDKRCIYQIENQPAALFYSEQLGMSKEEIKKDMEKYTMGIMIYNNAYVHDPAFFDEKDNIHLYSSIPQNAEVQILKATDMIEETMAFLEKNIRPIKHISGILTFTCLNRTRRALKENITLAYKEIFKDLPVLGFGTYGEFYISFINQTSIFLVFL